MHPPRKFVALTREQVRRVDEICLSDFHLPGLLLMEHAALALLESCRNLLGNLPGRRVDIICGGGNNGGDGYALARLLTLAGATVTLHATTPADDLEGDASTNARICDAMKIKRIDAAADTIARCETELLVDALLGTGLSEPPRENAAELILAMKRCRAPVLAVDVPSGLDCDTGKPLGEAAACVRATTTCTFVAPKVGFAQAGQWTGKVEIGDIGCPVEAVERAVNGD